MKALRNYLKYHIGGTIRNIRNIIDRKRYTNLCNGRIDSSPTIISQNCIGGVMYHDLGLRFNSPTINSFMKSEDYIKFIERLEYYLKIDAREMHFVDEKSYPVAYLDDIKIYFVHYLDKNQVIEKWNHRRKRVDMNNIYVIMTDRDGCNEDIIRRFLELKYAHKVLFSHRKVEHWCVNYMPCFRNEKQVGSLTDYCNIWGKRYYQKYFDYVTWLTERRDRKT